MNATDVFIVDRSLVATAEREVVSDLVRQQVTMARRRRKLRLPRGNTDKWRSVEAVDELPLPAEGGQPRVAGRAVTGSRRRGDIAVFESFEKTAADVVAETLRPVVLAYRTAALILFVNAALATGIALVVNRHAAPLLRRGLQQGGGSSVSASSVAYFRGSNSSRR